MKKLIPVFIRLDENLYKDMKVYITFNDITQQSFVEKAIDSYLRGKNEN